MIRSVCKAIAFLLIAGFLFAAFQVAYVPHHKNVDIFEDLYQKPKDSIDVLVLGASSIWAGIHPTVLWQHSGISGFNAASSAENALTSYYSLLDILRTQSPKVVVLDTYPVFTKVSDLDTSASESYMRIKFDAMQLSWAKVRAAVDIAQWSENQTALSYFFPLLRYHDRWEEVGVAQLQETGSRVLDHVYTRRYLPSSMGAEIQTVVEPFEALEGMGDYTERSSVIPESTRVYYDRIIDLCKERGIAVMFLRVPYANSQWNYARHNAIAAYAQAKEVDFLDMMLPQWLEVLQLDPGRDFRNATHLNVQGAQKTSAALGDYLQSTYALEDRRGDPEYAQNQLYTDEYLLDWTMPQPQEILQKYREQRENLMLTPTVQSISSESLRLKAGKKQSSNTKIYQGLEPEQTYLFAVGATHLEEGSASEITVTLYDTAKGKALFSKTIPLDEEHPAGCIIAIPQGLQAENLSLRIYAGKSGQTAGNTIVFTDLQLYRISQ